MRSASDISLLIDLWSIAVEMGIGPAAFPKAWKEKLVSRWCCAGGRGLVLVATCSVGVGDQRGLQEVMLSPPLCPEGGHPLAVPTSSGGLEGEDLVSGLCKAAQGSAATCCTAPPSQKLSEGEGGTEAEPLSSCAPKKAHNKSGDEQGTGC